MIALITQAVDAPNYEESFSALGWIAIAAFLLIITFGVLAHYRDGF